MYLECFRDRWVLRCHACYKVTQEVGKIFCPKCGNGGTLRKVSVTVSENGITMASRRPRITFRGTKGSAVSYKIVLLFFCTAFACVVMPLLWFIALVVQDG
jgi:hypothetical protein